MTECLIQLGNHSFLEFIPRTPSFISRRFCHDEVDLAKNAANYSPHTIFNKIIDGTLSAKIIHRDEKSLAFHDVNPQAPVHFLVIPIKPISMLEKVEFEDQEVY